MRKAIIDISKEIPVTGEVGNTWEDVARSAREEVIEALISELPQTVPCSFHSRSHESTVSISTNITVRFLLDDGVSILNFTFMSENPTNERRMATRVFFNNDSKSISGATLLLSYPFLSVSMPLTSSSFAMFRYMLEAVYSSVFLQLFRSGFSAAAGLQIVKLNIDSGFPTEMRWAHIEALSVRLAETVTSPPIFASFAITSLPYRMYETLNKPEIIKSARNLLVRNNEVVGTLGDGSGDVLLTSPISIAFGSPSGFFRHHEVLLDGVSYFVAADVAAYSLLIKM